MIRNVGDLSVNSSVAHSVMDVLCYSISAIAFTVTPIVCRVHCTNTLWRLLHCTIFLL